MGRLNRQGVDKQKLIEYLSSESARSRRPEMEKAPSRAGGKLKASGGLSGLLKAPSGLVEFTNREAWGYSASRGVYEAIDLESSKRRCRGVSSKPGLLIG